MHFAQAPVDAKHRHSVFKQKYRNSDTVKELVRRAASAPSRVVATRLTIETLSGREAIGRPCVKIVRRFGDAVGEDETEVCLVIIVDHGGTLITAYPATTKALE